MTEVNPFTGKRFSANYFKILEGRQKLPIFEAKESIQKLIRKYQAILLVGETGSGKTTQVPQFVLEMSPVGAIACTQPRRVAAMSVSERVAEEMDVALGDEVGYTIRFDDVSSAKTRIKYLTDGMLLREAMSDPTLQRYSVIILDEAHERTVHTDILIGTVKELLQRRPDLRVVVMSATLEEKKFQKYFCEAPLIHISGRRFGVEVFYAKAPESNYVEASIRIATHIHLYEGEGDILVFLCGEDEIENAVERLQNGIRIAEHSSANCHKGPVLVLPLYSALPPQQQKKVFKQVPEGTRKIVVATNVAETSLTIDGVVFVVDCGFAKQKVFNPKLRVESLLVTAVSQAAANQRCGRAGRTRPGKCFRLYTRHAFETLLQPQTHPEILRCNLGSIVLHMKKMGIEDFVHFDFVEPPAPETLMRALELLNYIGALDDDGALTSDGDIMSHFPVEPEMAATLLHSRQYKCGNEIAKICAMLSVQNPFFHNPKDAQRANRAREQFYHQTGDHLAMLQTFEAFEANAMSPDWCLENFLNSRAMKQAANVFKQLTSIMRRQGLPVDSDSEADAQYGNNIRKAILRGFFMNVAMALPTKNQYMTVKDNVKAILFPSTFLNRRPQFVVFNELVLTSNTYIRTVTAVSDDWLLESCASYFELDDFDGVAKQVLEPIWKRYRAQQQEQSGSMRKRQRDAGSDSD